MSIIKQFMNFQIFQSVKPEKKIYEQSVLIFLFYVESPNFSKIGTEIEKFLQFLYDPLKELLSKALFRIF